MDEAIIQACLAGLGAPPEGGMPGLLSRTTLERFELLQTPDLWGHDPADESYHRVAGGPESLPPGSRRLVAAIEEVIATAERIVDIASLEPCASGEFAAAIRDLVDGLPVDGGPCLHACRMETSKDKKAPSWNHAKIIAADGRQAIVGGHNLWHDDYLEVAPVHDLSARVTGAAAGEAHAFLDRLWDWVGQQLATPSDMGSVYAIRWAGGRLEPAGPPPAVALATSPAGPIPALALGRLGTGVLTDPKTANVGAAVAAIAFRQARSSIRISQMDFGFHWEGVNFWSPDVVSALADVLTDPARGVDVQLVLSETGAKIASGGPYSFGTTPADIVAEMRRAIGDRPLTGRMRIAPLRFSPTGDRWVCDGFELKITNHAKLWMVDDQAFHVGSDNIYPHNLQEFGYVVESTTVAGETLASYWEPLWKFSNRLAIDVVS
jgi:phosphatidylserine/phosphatidylglycerophosphate/cardiolipin synthase-like enzyme